MELSLAETATILGKTHRQVRYLINTGQIEARKERGVWRIESNALPLTDAQRESLAARLGAAREAVEKSFEPAAKVTGEQEEKRRYSVRDLRAFENGVSIYREMAGHLGGEALHCERVASVVVLLARGCHCFHPPEKARRFTEARDLAATAVAELFLASKSEDDTRHSLACRLEQELIPKIAALVASQEKRSRKSRFERFGSSSHYNRT